MKKGIVIVANLKSQDYAENLIYSIRGSGCSLPIRLIHFGGKAVNSKYILDEVEFLTIDDFSTEAKAFINNLRTVLTDCPMGFLYRFLAWFSDWDEFIYTDNDIVALMDWERLFEFSENYDLVHADEEYTTQGIYNYIQPDKVETIFGKDSLSSAITAGHMVVKKSSKMIVDMNTAVAWFKEQPEIPRKHDQSLLHIAALLGNWRILNLCKFPHNWLSTWSGDYKNSLDLIHAIQGGYEQKTASFAKWEAKIASENNTIIYKDSVEKNMNIPISHLHFSGRGRIGAEGVDELMFSSLTDKNRMMRLFKIQLADLFYVTYMKEQIKRIKRYLHR
ncbi:hypothetical protein FFWV33_12085 [Flavobacterium faecale]|uniref:Glycosyl transferase n=1 Tax=Flavobacterium faecale TaxID=1355330 RepID=A0A2S1LEJ4_9FLAO|nr:hypothetical protein [Flavobacterium faecale]AWG22200.1 hypothetical protein FFWV33_12085 [Flavobacterium faecale]